MLEFLQSLEPWQIWGGAISLMLGSGLGLLTAHWQLRRRERAARDVPRHGNS